MLLDENGVVKVTDLGLARLNHGAEGPAAGADVTMAGGVIGTADYMPPEQAVDSTTIDHRADIYSLGCTLHYLLTGKPPFSGATIMAILLKHRDARDSLAQRGAARFAAASSTTCSGECWPSSPSSACRRWRKSWPSWKRSPARFRR